MTNQATPIAKEKDRGYEFIRFMAMMMIVSFHLLSIFNEYQFGMPPLVRAIFFRGSTTIGGLGVALFMLLSGAVLIKNYKEKLSPLSFYKKRFSKIEPPQIIAYLLCFPLTYCIYPPITNTTPLGAIISMLGLNYDTNFWLQFDIVALLVVGEWFTAVIIICYILFPILRFLFIKYRLLGTILITEIFILNLKFQFLTYSDGWFSITNGIMCVWVGMLFETYKHFIKKSFVYLNYIFIITFVYINPITIFNVKYLPCFFLSISLFIVLYQITIENRFTKYTCKYNYEIYLLHHNFYRFILPALVTASSNNIQKLSASIFVIIVVFLSAKALQELTTYTLEQLKKLKSTFTNIKNTTVSPH